MAVPKKTQYFWINFFNTPGLIRFFTPLQARYFGNFFKKLLEGFFCSTVIIEFLGIFWRTRCCFLEVRRCWYCRNLAKKQWWPTAKGGLSLHGWRLKIKNNLSEKTYFQNVFFVFQGVSYSFPWKRYSFYRKITTFITAQNNKAFVAQLFVYLIQLLDYVHFITSLCVRHRLLGTTINLLCWC